MPNNIKELRKARNISVTELARRLNMSQGNLTKIENGQVELKTELAQKLADILQCPLERLLGLEEAAEPSPLALYLNLPSTARTITVRGDNLAPVLQSGDIAVVIPESVKKEDGLYLVQYKGRELLRRLQTLSDGQLALLCDNPAYQPEYGTPGEVVILGRVIRKIAVTAL